MDPKHFFYDDRLKGYCVYCGGPEETGDHAPSKVLLDPPYPPDLPVVPACEACNVGFSEDEKYLACLLECTIAGTVDPSKLTRERIRRKLIDVPALGRLIEHSSTRTEDGALHWHPDSLRVENVVLKLARGHIAFEEGTPRDDEPSLVEVVPLPALSPDEIQALLGPWNSSEAWPEIGSRAFLRTTGKDVGPPMTPDGWVIVQPGRYRYRVAQTSVQMVLSEYLSCTVTWE